MQTTDWLITRKEGDTVYFEVHQNRKLRVKIWLNYFLVTLIISTLAIIAIGSEGGGKIFGYFLALFGIFYAIGTLAAGLSSFPRQSKIKDVVKFSVSPTSINLIIKNRDSYPDRIERSDIAKLFLYHPDNNLVFQQQYEYSPSPIIGVGVVPVLTAAAMDASRGLGRSLGTIMVGTFFDIQNKVNKSSYYLGVNVGGTNVQLASHLLKDQAIFIFHKVEEALSGRTSSDNSNTDNRYSVTPAQLSAAGGGRVKTIMLFTVLSLVVAFKAYIYISPIVSKNLETQKYNEISKHTHASWEIIEKQVQEMQTKDIQINFTGEVTGRNVRLKNRFGSDLEELPVGTRVNLYGCSTNHAPITDETVDVSADLKTPSGKPMYACGYLNKKDFSILAENTSPTN